MLLRVYGGLDASDFLDFVLHAPSDDEDDEDDEGHKSYLVMKVI